MRQRYREVLDDLTDARVPTEWIQHRLDELRVAADEENIVWSATSEQAMWSFFHEFQVTAEPFLTLRDEGQLRALWEEPSGAQVGLRFLDTSDIQYVIFSAKGNGSIGRHYGVTDGQAIWSIIEATNVAILLNA